MVIIYQLGFYAANVMLQKMVLPDVSVKWITSARCIWGWGSWVQTLDRRPAILVDIFCGVPQFFQSNAVMVLGQQIRITSIIISPVDLLKSTYCSTLCTLSC